MIKVYYQGEKGSFSDIAALKFFNGKAQNIGLIDFERVFNAVRHHKDTYGIIPIENTLSGSLHHNYYLLLKSNLSIAGEIKIKISFKIGRAHV